MRGGGYRMPAEWAPHEGTLLTWPHEPSIWRGVHAEVEATFVEIARHVAEGEVVHVNVPDAAWARRVEATLRGAGVAAERLCLHEIGSDDVWARDHGPTVVVATAEAAPGAARRVAIDWDFNAWGGKYPHARDAAIARRFSEAMGWEREAPGLVLEGGAFEVNGAGALLTTEAVLLNPNRNPGVGREALEARLRGLLGVDEVFWLGAGIEGDDTDGHVDDLARFVSEDVVVTLAPPGATHPDHGALAANLARLEGMRRADGRGFEVRTLPLPEPVRFGDEHLPASHANFYVANACVLVPVFEQASDEAALELLRASFPERAVIGVDCRALVSQYGAIHCVTQQLPVVG